MNAVPPAEPAATPDDALAPSPPPPSPAGLSPRAPTFSAAAVLSACGTWRAWRLAALGWGLVALLAALLEQSQLAWGWTPPGPMLGAGRLLALYRLAARLGAFALPLMALAARLDRPEGMRPGARQGLARAFVAWNLGLLVGGLGLLAGWLRPEAWASQPVLADLLLLAGAILWLRALWEGQAGALDAAGRAAVLGGIGLVTCLALGNLLVQALGGLGQALGGALLGRGIDELALFPLAVAAACRWLPAQAGRPLYGRQSLVWGLWAWLVVAALSLTADLAPDLLGPGMGRWSDLLRPWALLPLGLLGLCLAGSFLGTAGSTALRRTPAAWDLLFAAGLGWLLAVRAAEAALSATAARLLQFSPAAPRAWELPAWGAWWCLLAALAWPRPVGAGSGEADVELDAPEAGGPGVVGSIDAAGPRPLGRPATGAVALALVCALGQSALALPLALAQGAAGGYGGLLSLEAGLRLPLWLGLTALVGGLLLRGWMVGRASAAMEAPARDLPLPAMGLATSPPGPAPQLYAATVGALLVTALLVVVLLPLVRTAGPPAAEDQLAVAPGRAAYVADGCVFCHSRRQRADWDAALFGPPTGVPAAGLPALAGLRRAGVDLSWVGERLADAPERLAVHAAGGRPALPWRFSAGGAGPEGEDLLDYLMAARPAPAGGPR